MKVLLRDTQTALLYAGPNQWTTEPNEAIDFERTDLAMEAVADSKLKTLEVLIHFDDPVFDIPLGIVGLGQ